MHYLKSQIRTHAIKSGAACLVFVAIFAVILFFTDAPRALIDSTVVSSTTQLNEYLMSEHTYFNFEFEDALFTGYYFLKDAEDENSDIAGLGYIVPIDGVYLPFIMPANGVTLENIESMDMSYGAFSGMCTIDTSEFFAQYPEIIMRDFAEQNMVDIEVAQGMVYPIMAKPIDISFYIELVLAVVCAIALLIMLVRLITIVLRAIGVIPHPIMKALVTMGETDQISAAIDQSFSTDVVYKNASAVMSDKWLIGKKPQVSISKLSDIERTSIDGAYKRGYTVNVMMRDGTGVRIKFRTKSAAEKFVEQLTQYTQKKTEAPREYMRAALEEQEHVGTLNPNTIFETHMAHLRQMGLAPANSNEFHKHIFDNYESELNHENCYAFLLKELGKAGEKNANSDDIYTWDLECITDEDEYIYETILHNMVRITKNTFNISDVGSEMFLENEDVSYVEFKARGKKYRYEMSVKGKLFDIKFVEFLNECLKDSFVTRSFYVNIDGKTAQAIFSDDMAVEKLLEHTGVMFRML